MQTYIYKKGNDFLLILILGLLETITPFSIDMYLPAFPGISKDLNTTVENISLSVSSYFLGFAIGQILYGPLLDRYGRKKPLYIGLCIYIAATIGCVFCHTLNAFLVVRFIQALGGCVCSVTAIAMVQDLFPQEKRASNISFLILTIGLSPMLAPSVGSLVLGIWNWNAVFFSLAIIAAIMLVVSMFFLPNGAPPDKSISLKPKPILTVFQKIITEPVFYVYTVASSFAFAGLFIYVAGSPAVFMGHFHLTPKQYGGVFALLSVGLIGGSQLNHFLTKRFDSKVLFSVMLAAHGLVGVVFAVTVYLNILPLADYLVCIFLVLLCIGIEGPNATAVSMEPFEKNAGSASSLLGFIRIGIGGVVSACVGLFHMEGNMILALGIAASAIAAMLFFLLGKKAANADQTLLVTE